MREVRVEMSNRRQLIIIFLIIFVNLIGFGIIIPILPFYAENVGATPLQIGLLFASYSVAQIVASPVLGSWSDRYGRRPILLLSLLGTVISFVMLATATSLAMLFAARILDGLSGGNIPTARAYISDITEEKDRAKAFGIIGAAFGLGFIFGPALGGLLGQVNSAAPAWGAASLALVALLMTFVQLPETRHRARAARPAPWRELPLLIRRPVLGNLLIVDFLYWASFAVYQTTFTLFASIRFDFGMTEVGYFLAFVGFIGVLVQGVFVGPVVRRLGEKRTLVLGLVLAAAGLGSASVIYSVPLFVAALVPASIGAALSSPALVALLSQASGREEQGRVQGVSGALESLGRTVGPIWGNGVLGFFGEGMAYLTAAVAILLLAVLSFRLDVDALRRDVRQRAEMQAASTPPLVEDGTSDD
jgi:DHA1 family tetracycline resistance protein-like MFS transporter